MDDFYGVIAPIYDRWNADVDFAALAAYVRGAISHWGAQPANRILDLACGTGSMSLALAETGCSVIGLDLSEDMLSVADNRIRRAGLSDRVFLTQQDMTDFDVGEPVDAVVCTLDGINHLPAARDVASAFAAVRRNIRSGGLFLFDLNSRFRFETEYADRVYVREFPGCFCVWENFYRPASHLCDFFITAFCLGQGGTYTRREAFQRERYYPLATVRRLLSANGFSLVACHGDLTGREIVPNDPKWYLVARADA